MTRLKLSDITDVKPVKLSIEISARLHSDLVAYGVVLNGGNERELIAPMLERFVATDRDFAKARRAAKRAEV